MLLTLNMIHKYFHLFVKSTCIFQCLILQYIRILCVIVYNDTFAWNFEGEIRYGTYVIEKSAGC